MSPNPKVRTVWVWLVLGAALGGAVIAAGALWPGDHGRAVATGFAALFLVTGCAVYGARKWLFVARFGSLHAWMVGHLLLGVALAGAVLAHADLADLGGPGWVLIGLLALQVGSGAWATFEMFATPRRFARFGAGELAFPTTARRRLAVLTEAVERILARRGPELRAWFDERYRSVLDGRTHTLPALEGFPVADARVADDLHGRATEIAQLRGILGRLEVAERASTRWTWIHVPATVALSAMVVLHVIGWLIYG